MKLIDEANKLKDTEEQGSPILNQRAAQLILGSIKEIILHKINAYSLSSCQ
jgi:hypothetical protein